jgi:protein-disulfide isomerase
MPSNTKLIVVGLFISIVALVGGAILVSNSTESKPVDLEKVVGDKRWQKGNGEAKVVIVEFSDFQCPACRGAASEIERVIDTYGEKVGFVYRHFPLTTIHANAFDAAVAAEIAGSEGKFWEMHDLLFERQDEWSDDKDARKLFGEYAVELDLEGDQFLSAFDSGSFEDLVLFDTSDAKALGVSATPTFFVGDRAVSTNELDSVILEIIGNE